MRAFIARNHAVILVRFLLIVYRFRITYLRFILADVILWTRESGRHFYQLLTTLLIASSAATVSFEASNIFRPESTATTLIRW